jgi:hypothetical protein
LRLRLVRLSACAGLGAAALLWGCAGELDKDPTVFKGAYTDGTNPSTGGTSSTGGTGTVTGGTGTTTGGTGTTTGGTGTTTGGSSGMIPPDDPCVASVIAAKGCTACHSTAAASLIGANLVLEGTNLGARLSTTKATYMGVAASMNPGACVQGALIIDPVTPANSILLKKVSGTQVCGDKMPQGTGLSGEDLKCFQDWINKF